MGVVNPQHHTTTHFVKMCCCGYSKQHPQYHTTTHVVKMCCCGYSKQHPQHHTTTHIVNMCCCGYSKQHPQHHTTHFVKMLMVLLCVTYEPSYVTAQWPTTGNITLRTIRVISAGTLVHIFIRSTVFENDIYFMVFGPCIIVLAPYAPYAP